MTTERRFEELIAEFERVGVDHHSFPAGIGVRREDAMRALRALPDDAGPAAFLSKLRELGMHQVQRDGAPRDAAPRDLAPPVETRRAAGDR